MKKFVKSITVIAIMAAAFIFGLNVQNQEIVKAYEEDPTYIGIDNQTPFELKNIQVVYNDQQKSGLADLQQGKSGQIDLPQTEEKINKVQITGDTSDGKKFSATFDGPVKDNTALTVVYSDELSTYVTSDIEELQY